MKTQRMNPIRVQSMSRHWLAAPAAFMVTMLALPVNAGIVIPDDPLTSAARVAPNILLILDDSGSMASDVMPDDECEYEVANNTAKEGCAYRDRNNNIQYRDGTRITTNVNVSARAYTVNSLSYNPAITYQPWVKADGTRMTGGTSFNSVYGSFNKVGGTPINLGLSTSCRNYNKNSGNKDANNPQPSSDEAGDGADVCGGIQTFYVPKLLTGTSAAYLKNGENYYRYQITGSDVIRSTYGDVTTSPLQSLAVAPSSGTVTRNSPAAHTVATVPANAVLYIKITSTTSNTTLYQVKDPYGNIICNSDISDNNSKTCTVNSALAGQYKVNTSRYNNNTGNASYTLSASYTTTNRCGNGSDSKDWIDCQSNKTPTSRSIAAEQVNYATWFSYHRTRMKAAKAGASEAFKPLNKKVRVGFRTIWGRTTTNATPIPVSKADGRFIDDSVNSITNRDDWYASMQSVVGYYGTPLHSALQSAGEYFEGDTAGGAYGPESGGAQYACRQNFAILTTDGYWNSNVTDVGDQDSSAGSTITGPKGATYTFAAGKPFTDSRSGTLADIAMKYWKRDLRTLTNNVPASEANPAFWQHMVTFGISIGLSGTTGWKSVEEVKGKATVTWPNPNDKEDADRIDDLLHAAVNGHGAFVAATSPDEFTRGLKAALATIAQRTSSYSNVATNAASLRTGGQVFNASYVSGIWTGSVKAWNLDGTGGKPGTQKWVATIPAWGTRNIFTYKTSGETFPTDDQLELLERTGGPVSYPVSAIENANYLKGKQDLEGSNVGDLRIRTSVLGDIVGSSPAYVEDTKTLYVGSNDGMLHAFSTVDGKEQFAYVPGLINFGDLSTLSSGDYTHKFFVDGPIVVSDRKLTPGSNLLVGALGRGGKGVYFLDVSAPGSFGTSKVTKELAETSGGNMGLVLGRPILAKVKAGSNATAAVFGNGVNSSSGKAVLIVANLATGAVIGEIDTSVIDSNAGTNNGLSAPTGVVGPDGKTLAYVYAGDMLGNVWKFDVRDSDPTTWASKTKKLFTAKLNGTGAAQPITGSVTVALDPRSYKRWVLFGTGSFLTIADADDKTVASQSMYGFVDSDATVAFADLKLRTIINTGATQDGFPVRTFESKTDLPANKKGWYVNLPGEGERIVQDAQMVSNILVTASMVPTGDACESAGSGYINAVDAFTGTSAGKSFFDLDGDGDTSDTKIGGVPVGSVNFGVGMPTLPLFLDGRLIVGGTGGDNGGGEKPGTGGIVRKTWSRVSWREIKRD